MCFNVKMTADSLKLENRYGVKAQLAFDGAGEGMIKGFDHPSMAVLNSNGLSRARWGLIPAWTADRSAALQIQNQTLNAKVETVFDKPSFSRAIHKGRCIVPVQSFYEWQHQGRHKIPFEILATQDEFLSLAGICETWISPQTQTPVHSFSILTCAANELMSTIHNTKKRMPLIIAPDQIDPWLSPDLSLEQIQQLMQPYPDHWLRAQCLQTLGPSQLQIEF